SKPRLVRAPVWALETVNFKGNDSDGDSAEAAERGRHQPTFRVRPQTNLGGVSPSGYGRKSAPGDRLGPTCRQGILVMASCRSLSVDLCGCHGVAEIRPRPCAPGRKLAPETSWTCCPAPSLAVG